MDEVYVYNIKWNYSLIDVIADNQDQFNQWCLTEFSKPSSSEIIQQITQDSTLQDKFQENFLSELPKSLEIHDVSPFEVTDIENIMGQIGDFLSNNYSFTVSDFDIAGVFYIQLRQKLKLRFKLKKEYSEPIENLVYVLIRDTFKEQKEPVLIDRMIASKLTEDKETDGVLYELDLALLLDEVKATAIKDKNGYPTDKFLGGFFHDDLDLRFLEKKFIMSFEDYVPNTLSVQPIDPEKKDILQVKLDW